MLEGRLLEDEITVARLYGTRGFSRITLSTSRKAEAKEIRDALRTNFSTRRRLRYI